MSEYVSQVLADKPLRYYRMDEMSGTVLHDLGSQKQDGTISGTVTFAQQGLLGSLIRDADTAIAFDGSTGKVTLPSTGLPGNTSAPFTLECWAMYPTLPAINTGTSSLPNITAQDTFTRANQSGWGTSSDGEGWTDLSGAATLSIASNEGVVTGHLGNDTYLQLGSQTGTNVSALVRLAVTEVSNEFAGIALRMTNANNVYVAYINGLHLWIDKTVGGVTTHTRIDRTFTSGTFYWMRFTAIGSTISVRVWQDGTGEPGTWDISLTDTSLSSGGFGLYNSSSASGDQVQFDHFSITRNETPIFLGTRVSGNNQEASFQFDHTTQQWFFELGTSSTLYISDTILVGAIYHLVATYDGAYLTLYLNGRQRASSHIGTITLTYGAALLGVNASNQWYSGVVDEVAIYSTSLSIDRIASHYYAGIGSNPPVAPRLSWLSVSPDGRIVNEQGEVVLLRGVNTAGLEYGDALGGKDFQTWIESFSQLAVNLWRVSINVSWWNNNVAVPGSALRYRDYIVQLITWMKLSGCYVEIDPTNYCTIVPAKSGPQCSDLGDPPSSINCISSQDTSNNPPWTQQQKIDATIAFFQSFIPLYKDDPAVLYDALNEPASFSDPFAANNQMIDVIRSMHPQSLIMVYGQGNAIANGEIADNTQPNLVWDFHIYDGYPSSSWQNKLADRVFTFDYAQSHGRAIMIGEWSITGVTNDPQGFAYAIANLAVTQGLAVSYYTDLNLIGSDFVTPTSDGLTLASAYHEIAGIPGGYPFSVYLDNPVRYYRLNEITGTISYDLGSQRQNGTITGGVTQEVTGLLRNQSTAAMSFDGSTGYISLPTTGLVTGTHAWSIEAWVKTASTLPGAPFVLVFFGTATANEGAELYLDGSRFKTDSDGASTCRSETILVNSTYHVVGTYDGTNYRIYVNGQLSGGPTSFTTNIVTGSAFIGKTPSGNYFNSIIEEVAIYDYAISAIQVDRHYLAGLGFPVRQRNG